MPEVAQSGRWDAAATGSSSTTFSLDEFAYINPRMVGWVRVANEPQERAAFRGVQPDINQQVYLPVTGVTPSNGTLTVAGDYASLGQPGKRWRLYAPPGVETYTSAAGTLSRWVSAVDSRCLYAGYRYESPLAGIWDGSAAQHRQTGTNFAGLHYTLHRHYDPVLMRFTSPDPIADPWWNLNAYVGNSPARYYDPDGLGPIGDLFRGGWTWADETLGLNGFGTGIGNVAGGIPDTGWRTIKTPFELARWGFTGETPEVFQIAGNMWDRTTFRYDTMTAADSAWYDTTYVVVAGGVADAFGMMTIHEAYHKQDSGGGGRLTDEEANARWVEGTVTTVGYATMAGGPKFFGGPKGGTPRRLALAEANRAQGLRPRPPGTAGSFVKGKYKTTAVSGRHGQIKLHPAVQEFMDSIPQNAQSRFHCKCCEPRMLSDSLYAGVNPRGGTAYTNIVRRPGRPDHGAPVRPCSSCELLLDHFGVTWSPVTRPTVSPIQYGGALMVFPPRGSERETGRR